MAIQVEKEFQKRLGAKNDDLWKELDRLRKERGIKLEAEKMKAHVSSRSLINGDHSLNRFVGNFLADAVCGATAKDGIRVSEAAQELRTWEGRAELKRWLRCHPSPFSEEALSLR